MFSTDITHTLEVRKQNMLPSNTIILNFLVLHPHLWEGKGVKRRNELSSSKFCCFYAILSLTPLAPPGRPGTGQ